MVRIIVVRRLAAKGNKGSLVVPNETGDEGSRRPSTFLVSWSGGGRWQQLEAPSPINFLLDKALNESEISSDSSLKLL